MITQGGRAGGPVFVPVRRGVGTCGPGSCGGWEPSGRSCPPGFRLLSLGVFFQQVADVQLDGFDRDMYLTRGYDEGADHEQERKAEGALGRNLPAGEEEEHRD